MKPALLILLFVLLSACSPVLTATPTLTTTLAVPSPMPTITPSATPLPTETPAPPTITPLPTVPTFTPTFDARTIVTATPAPKAECPAETTTNESFSLPISKPNEYGPEIGTAIDNYLKKGGKIASVIKKLDQAISSRTTSFNGSYRFQDLTGDGIDDLVFVQTVPSDFHPIVFLCDHGSYKSVIPHPKTKYYLAVWLENLVDLNVNGIPEIIISSSMCGGACGQTVHIFEWNGQEFQAYSDFHEYIQELTFQDIDHNGTKEIVAFVTGNPGGNLHRSEYLPKRYHRIIYGWNGSDIAQIEDQYDPPVYRFQAVQDGDRFSVIGKYAEALAMYKAASSDKKLDWWSPERASYVALDEDVFYAVNPPETPFPTPAPNLTEYPRLASYAYYRMAILHTHLGQTDATQLQYATLQEKFPPGDPGHPYVEMASAFWDAYQSRQKMYDGCAAAIAYADAHREILIPLGSDYHGWQSHTYVPADVCPFR